MSELRRFRVATVVFADVEAVDRRDANAIVATSVAAALTDDNFLTLPVEMAFIAVHAEDRPVRFVDVRPLDSAIAGGLLNLAPSDRVWREAGFDPLEDE